MANGLLACGRQRGMPKRRVSSELRSRAGKERPTLCPPQLLQRRQLLLRQLRRQQRVQRARAIDSRVHNTKKDPWERAAWP